MRYLLSAVAVSLMLLTNSCNHDKMDSGKPAVVNKTDVGDFRYPDDTIGLPINSLKSGSDKQPDAPQRIDWDKKIVKTGTLSIEVNNFGQYNNSIHQLVRKWGAYIASEQENSSEYKIENSLTIKIPVEYFDEAVQQLSADSGKLLVKQISAQDVTAEYSDTKARMETKRRIRLRYLDMLQQAKNMEEILQIEREINGVQEQVEAAGGRISYLGHVAAYSTIQLNFFQVLNATVTDPNKPGFVKRMGLAMRNGSRWVGELLIMLVTLWPLWVGITFGIWVIRRIMRRSVPGNPLVK